MDSFRFVEAYLLHIEPVVGDWSAISPFLGGGSDSSERSALINSSEEMGQARDTSTCVTFNALNSTSSPRILDSLFMLLEGEKMNLQMFS